ncbi:MAG: septal ring lytic transglycosylase RlpA family protein [Verrucomicrobiaceae bacterium]|nr:septal ring lytic transglycosylase RlpA family protein [Verrucomicrobiaceae bacterium]
MLPPFFRVLLVLLALALPVAAETGKASYYADKFHGRPTASGIPYDRNGYTAAHHTLPFGTVLNVTNISNGRTVRVTVNDRIGHKGRIIDLSYAAASQIDMIRQGIANVTVEINSQGAPSANRNIATPTKQTYPPPKKLILTPTTPPPSSPQILPADSIFTLPGQNHHSAYEAQFGAFVAYNKALQLHHALAQKGITTQIFLRGNKRQLYRVISSWTFASEADAVTWLRQLHTAGRISEGLALPRGW